MRRKAAIAKDLADERGCCYQAQLDRIAIAARKDNTRKPEDPRGLRQSSRFKAAGQWYNEEVRATASCSKTLRQRRVPLAACEKRKHRDRISSVTRKLDSSASDSSNEIEESVAADSGSNSTHEPKRIGYRRRRMRFSSHI